MQQQQTETPSLKRQISEQFWLGDFMISISKINHQNQRTNGKAATRQLQQSVIRAL
jgi:hypothetical protein